MIKKELDFIYITTDGSKFIHKKEAEFWQDHLDRIDVQILKDYEAHDQQKESKVTNITNKWINKIKGKK